MSILYTIYKGTLELLFPSSCLSCRERGKIFCSRCLSDSPAAERESEEWIFPIYDYRHPPIKRAIWLLKYKNSTGLAKIFADSLYPHILEELSERGVMENFNNPILIPIPLSPARQRERGYNQSELLCKYLMELDEQKSFILEKKLLLKPRDTVHQARIRNRSERLKNLSGSFFVRNPGLLKGRNIILVDDVTTTGATLSEARKVLKQSGARKIIAFTIAH
jgi:competence protein ComFC